MVRNPHWAFSWCMVAVTSCRHYGSEFSPECWARSFWNSKDSIRYRALSDERKIRSTRGHKTYQGMVVKENLCQLLEPWLHQPVTTTPSRGATWSMDGPCKAQLLNVLPGLTVKVAGRPLPNDVLSTAYGGEPHPDSCRCLRSSPFEGAREGSQPESNEAALALDSNRKDKRATSHRHHGTEPVLPMTCGTLPG